MTSILKKTKKIIDKYLLNSYSDKELFIINEEIRQIIGENISNDIFSDDANNYEQLQGELAHINEKETIRKTKGVYYTPNDVVNFIMYNVVKFSNDILKPNNLHVMDLNGVNYSDFCFKKSVFDPTCGAGEFLLSILNIKIDLLELHKYEISNLDIRRVISTIYGNDINNDSITITKLRLFLCLLKRLGTNRIKGTADIINGSFYNFDYVIKSDKIKNKFDIIIGNPPYVEDNKSGLKLSKRYGNIYANVLENSSLHLKNNGVIGFIVPISYISTLRMRDIREELNNKLKEQYILSYCDRPDCLFTSVHQKLNIIICKKTDKKELYTGNYRYWYREERKNLFETERAVKNDYFNNEYIPKLGTKLDVGIYKKINANKVKLSDLINSGDYKIYLNMRAAFWIKAFLSKHNGREYKEYKCNSKALQCFIVCLLNSSLFWWFWICISDCWHITNKELNAFKIPNLIYDNKYINLAQNLEKKLEKTKLYVGTIQTEYEYKHKYCINEIQAIDDYIAKTFCLTEEENIYIKNFALRYRVGGGVENESN